METISKDGGERNAMIQVEVVNLFSGRFGQTGVVRPHEWNGDNFWVRVQIHRENSLIARRDLREI